jgi:hypothetical protein
VELANNQKLIMTNWLYSITILAGICSVSYFFMTLDYFNGELLTRDNVNSLSINYIIGVAFTLIPVMMIVFPQVIYGLPVVSIRESIIAEQGVIASLSKDQKLIKELEDDEKENFQKLAEKIIV